MLQEAHRLSRLVTCVRDTVTQLRKGVTGLLLMSEDLETLQCSLLSGKVPQCWHFAYPSLKPLTSWANDLSERVEQINKWGLVSHFCRHRLRKNLESCIQQNSRKERSAPLYVFEVLFRHGQYVHFRTVSLKPSGWAALLIQAPS